MKRGAGKEYRISMLEYMKDLYKHCVDSLYTFLSNNDNSIESHFYAGLFDFSHLLNLKKRIEEAGEREDVSFTIQDWRIIYTSLSLYCIVFSEKALEKMMSEVNVHPELGTEHDIELIQERRPKIRLMVNNLEKRLGHQPLFRQRMEEVKRRGWIQMMDPLPKYNILK
jgi:hypothetical protein